MKWSSCVGVSFLLIDFVVNVEFNYKLIVCFIFLFKCKYDFFYIFLNYNDDYTIIEVSSSELLQIRVKYTFFIC